MNVTNLTNSGVLSSDSVQDSDYQTDASVVILSVVLPIFVVLFCIAYVVWDMEKSTRPEKKDKNESKVATPDISKTNVQPDIENSVIENKNP